MQSFPSSRLKPVYFALSVSCILSGAVCHASFRKAGALYFEGNPAGALEEYGEAIKSGASPEVYLNAAFVARELGDPVRARDIMADALKQYPDDLQVKRLAASVFLSAGEFERAEQVYASVAGTARDIEVADLIGLARARLLQKDYTRALDAASSAADMDSGCAAAWFYKGEIYSEMGKTDDAADAFSRVLDIDPQFLEARRHLAALRIAQRRMDEAWTNYQKLAYAEPAVPKFKEMADGLKRNISKKPAEIIPPKTAVMHRALEHASGIKGLPALRIGIGTTASGQPSDSGLVEFVTAAPFEILDAKTRKRILRGPAKQKWRIAISKDNPKKAWIKDQTGRIRSSFSSAVVIRQPGKNANTVIIKSLLLGHGTAWAAIADKELRGDIEIRKLEKRLAIINIVNVEEYVYGVLASEMPVRYPFEALKAQAVLARTYAMKNSGKHKAEGYDLCDSQHCQVYGGVGGESSRGNSAVDATRGEILTYDGKPAQTVFSANGGGFTQSGASAGWGDVPYWGVVSDYDGIREPPSQPFEFDHLYKTLPKAYCEGSFYVKATHYRWTRVVRTQDIAKEVSARKEIGEITAIVLVRRGLSGHISRMVIKGTKGDFPLDKEYQVRKYLGDGLLRSAAFVMEPVYRNGKPVEYLFYGAGWGHGVGFCQSGSSGRASAGQKYGEMLETYFPGVKLSQIKREK
ncbi:MAG: SpoIID/LytB domain-containing protein [Elusimicrobiaceae bacterium]|nr:SpoIID/LytB domain-containing protein [Elusimicrobiaceae bacterium]